MCFPPPQQGAIRIGGDLVTGPSDRTATVFQAPALLSWRTVLRNVTYGLEINGMRPEAARDKGVRYLALVGLADFADRYPHELAGGMQQQSTP